MNEDIDNDKDYQIMELKQRISYYEPYKQKYEDLKEDWKYTKSLLDKEFNERTRLKKENEELKNDDLLFFQQVFNILMKYQHLFNREMADEVLEDLGIELTEWFE